MTRLAALEAAYLTPPEPSDRDDDEADTQYNDDADAWRKGES